MLLGHLLCLTAELLQRKLYTLMCESSDATQVADVEGDCLSGV